MRSYGFTTDELNYANDSTDKKLVPFLLCQKHRLRWLYTTTISPLSAINNVGNTPALLSAALNLSRSKDISETFARCRVLIFGALSSSIQNSLTNCRSFPCETPHYTAPCWLSSPLVCNPPFDVSRTLTTDRSLSTNSLAYCRESCSLGYWPQPFSSLAQRIAAPKITGSTPLKDALQRNIGLLYYVSVPRCLTAHMLLRHGLTHLRPKWCSDHRLPWILASLLHVFHRGASTSTLSSLWRPRVFHLTSVSTPLP